MDEIPSLLTDAERPVFIWGAGMRPYAAEALALAKRLCVPVATTWGAIDLLNHDDPLMCGGFGTHGTRAANFAVQNSDLLVALGCRLDTKATGTPKDFAPKAKIVMVDIDQAEIDKMPKVGRKIDIGICDDVGEFLKGIGGWYLPMSLHGPWVEKIQEWKTRYKPKGEAYDLMEEISKYTTKDDIIVSDTGNTLGWIMQGFPFKGERFIHAFNFTPMGYGLGGAIGAAFATERRVIAIVGDGGAMMSLPELATIRRHDLNIKIILLNNGAHSMCMATQRQWLGGKYPATSIAGGLGFPKDWRLLAKSFGIDNAYSFDDWRGGGPSFMDVKIDPLESLAFQVKFGEPIA